MKKYIKPVVCLLLSVCLMFSAVSCGKADKDNTGSVTSGTSSSKKPSKGASSKSASSTGSEESASDSPTDPSSPDVTSSGQTSPKTPSKVKDVWINVPMVSKALLDAGYTGGEGCEMILGLCVDDIDGQLGFFGTDVEGTYRTEDGGKNWMIVGVGLKCAGACGFAIDPTNKDRVLCVGANSSALKYNGVYLSTDRGDSWSYVCEATTYNYRDQHTQIAFDKSSYDKKLGYCTVAYWSREDNAAKNTKDNSPGLYKTSDGGKTWKLLSGTGNLGSADVAVNPSNGTVYVGNKNGVFVSTDGGKSFKKTLSATVLSLDAVLTRPGTVWCTTDNELCVSNDSGKTWSRSHPSGFPQLYAAHLRVSPANPNKMIVQYDEGTYKSDGSPNKNVIRFSSDGGKTWQTTNLHFEGWWVPPHANGISRFAWSPVDENKVISNISQCQICVSNNGGRDFYWSNAGNSGFCAASLFRFNVNNPNLVGVASQDYNAGHSTDGGRTWTYVNWSGKGWGGMTYGCYMMTANDVVCGVSTEWYSKTHEVEICVTHDGGKTITRTGINTSNTPIGMGALGNDNIAFFADYRTTDKGKTWKKMNGCTAVFEVDRKTGRLWGANGSTAVFSDDNGATWKNYANLPSKITDMAYDSINKYLYVADATNSVLHRSTVSGSTGSFKNVTVTEAKTAIKNVAVDQNTGTVYAGESGSTDHSQRRVYRSTDQCKTWKCLTRTLASDRTNTPYGPRSVSSLTVKQDTGEMFVAGGCTGVWKIEAP